jgi:hypothetical protein
MQLIMLWSAHLLFGLQQPASNHAFDGYSNDVLTMLLKTDGVRQVKELTPELLIDHQRVLQNIKASFVVVKTNEGRYSRLLVQAAGQKVGDKTLPILLVERFVTYKAGEERTVVAEGKEVRLFQDFQFSLDLGQVVPASVGGDIRLIVMPDKTYAEPIGKAELYLVTKPLAQTATQKADQFVAGATFEPKSFNGTYQLYDDGRRSGKLMLKLGTDRTVEGWFYSDKDGAKYEVTGKVGEPNHAIKFSVRLPKVAQEFQGWMFTGDGRAICGVSRMQEREAGFYALRVVEE